MTYVKQTWANGVAGGTPISAARLAYIEEGIENATSSTNITKFGADPTGVAVSTQAIRDAYTEAGVNGTVFWPPGVYKGDATDPTITVSCNTWAPGAEYQVAGAGKTAIQVGTTATSCDRKTLVLPIVRQTAIQWWSGASPAAVGTDKGYHFVAADSCQVFIQRAIDFSTGLFLGGSTSSAEGVAYNTFTIAALTNNARNLVADPTNGSFVNQNVFIGGRFAHTSGGNAEVGLRQIALLEGNNNIFIGASLEGDRAEFQLELLFAIDNEFRGCRWETTATSPKVHFGEKGGAGQYAQRNTIEGGFDVQAIVATQSTNSRRNHIRGATGWRGAMGDSNGAIVLANQNSVGDPLITLLTNTNPFGVDHLTAYAMSIGAFGLKAKAVTDAQARIFMDGALGRLFLGDGGTDPTLQTRLRHSAGALEVTNVDVNISTAGKVLKVAGTQVVGARGAAVADATDAATAISQLNALLARLRAHGLIAP